MRHGLSGNKLGRNQSWRRATIRDVAKATLKHQRVMTTMAKAKEARKLIDQIITLGKKGTLAHRRKAFSILCDHTLVSDLFTKTSPRFHQRNGGYTRIVPLSIRRGDNAQLAYLELTEKEKVIVSKPKSAATSKTEDLKPTAEKKAEAKTETKPQKKDVKEPKLFKTDPSKSHPQKGTSSKDKIGPSKKIVGGLKKIFRKRPTD